MSVENPNMKKIVRRFHVGKVHIASAEGLPSSGNEGQEERRHSLLNTVLSILALVFTLIFGLISYFSTCQLADIAKNTTNTTAISTQALQKADMSFALSYLVSPTAASSYILRAQKQASLNKPSLCLPEVNGGYSLTEEGKNILVQTNLWDDTKLEVKNSPNNSTSDILLSLGIDRLYLDAVNHGLSIEKLIGIVATLIQQLQINKAY